MRSRRRYYESSLFVSFHRTQRPEEVRLAGCSVRGCLLSLFFVWLMFSVCFTPAFQCEVYTCFHDLHDGKPVYDLGWAELNL